MCYYKYLRTNPMLQPGGGEKDICNLCKLNIS